MIALMGKMTHLVAAPNGESTVHSRRLKFSIAVVKGCNIVNLRWLIESNNEGGFISTNQFLVTDAQVGFPLRQSITSVRATGDMLLDGIIIVLCGGVAKKKNLPSKDGFTLLANLTGVSLVTHKGNLTKISTASLIVITNDTSTLAKNPTEAVECGAMVMLGVEFMNFKLIILEGSTLNGRYWCMSF